MSGVIYEGVLDGSGREVEVIAGGKRMPLKLRLDLARHSPTGFNWGYAGSGPAQLAVALLAFQLKRYPEDRELAAKIAAFPEEGELPPADTLAVRLHQAFKSACIARLPQGRGFRLTDADVRMVLREMAGLDEPPQQRLPGVA